MLIVRPNVLGRGWRGGREADASRGAFEAVVAREEVEKTGVVDALAKGLRGGNLGRAEETLTPGLAARGRRFGRGRSGSSFVALAVRSGLAL